MFDSVNDQINSGGFPQKIPSQSYQNSSSSIGQQNFGPATLHHNYEGHQFGHQGYRSPYVPNPSIPHPPNSNMPHFVGPRFPPNYQIHQPIYQQPNPSPVPRNPSLDPRHYFPPNPQVSTTVQTGRISKNENSKLEKAPKKFSKASSEESMK